MSKPVSSLEAILRALEIAVLPEPYVYVVARPGEPILASARATILEDEGLTAVVRERDAEAAGIRVEFRAAWLTVTVHTDLHGVGLTAALSAALAAEKISCNMLAGLHHDHLLVPYEDRERAVRTLRALRG